MSKILQQDEKQKILESLEGWRLLDDLDALAKSFVFKNFNAAFSWMTSVALKAEKIDHHPEWFNVYNRVDVILTTHSAGGISELDVEMAKFMDTIL